MGDAISACVQDDTDDAAFPSSFKEISDDVSGAIMACVSTGLDVENDDDRGDFMSIPHEDASRNREVALENTLSRLGCPVREFYQVPLQLDKPVGSRVLPDFNSKRSGCVYCPGAIVEVVQEVAMDGVKYFRTEDKKGWLFAYHPKLQITMLEHIPGNYVIQNVSLRCISSFGPLVLREGPGLLSKVLEGRVYPNEEIDTVACWFPGDGSGMCFYKLDRGRGWVQGSDSEKESDFFVKLTS